MPLGPKEVLSRLETERAAMMLCFWACRPLMRLLACCSFRMMKGRPYSSKTMDMVRAVPRSAGFYFSSQSARLYAATACSEDASARAAVVWRSMLLRNQRWQQ